MNRHQSIGSSDNYMVVNDDPNATSSSHAPMDLSSSSAHPSLATSTHPDMMTGMMPHRREDGAVGAAPVPAVLLNDDPFMMRMNMNTSNLLSQHMATRSSQSSKQLQGSLNDNHSSGIEETKLPTPSSLLSSSNRAGVELDHRAMISSLSDVQMNPRGGGGGVDAGASATHPSSLMMTNTSPTSMLHPSSLSSSSPSSAGYHHDHNVEKVSPGSRLNSVMMGNTTPQTVGHQSMRMFLSKMAHQSIAKGNTSTSGKGGGSPDASELDMNLPFPVKLHYILSNPKYKEVISWLPHGRAWRIIKPKEFEKYVIPKFFRSAKYASFMRQVNGWAFTRVTEGPDLNAYYHEMFLRGIPSLCFQMKRPPKVKSAAAAARNAASGGNVGVTGQPNFYRICKIAPLPPAAPFRPVIAQQTQEASSTKSATPEETADSTGNTATTSSNSNTRYDIEMLKVEDIRPLGEEITEGKQHGSTSSSNAMMIEWPDDSSSEQHHASTKEAQDTTMSGSIRSSTSGGKNDDEEEQTQSQKDKDKGDDDDEEQKSEDEIIQELSKADIRYLAYQNQIILKHVGSGSSSPSSSSLEKKASTTDETKTTTTTTTTITSDPAIADASE